MTAGISLALGIAGPFNTFDADPLFFRMYFWGTITTVSAVYANFCVAVFESYLPSATYLVRSVLSGAVFIPVYFLFVRVFSHAHYPAEFIPSDAFLFAAITGVTAAIFCLLAVMERMVSQRIASETALASPVPATNLVLRELDGQDAANDLLKRAGHEAGSKLKRMAMADHYVELYSETGKHLLHMRFTDAIELLPNHLGGQVHRSHWIAWDEVETTDRDGQKRFFIMKDGAQVPIARSRVKELQQRGILT